MSAGSMLLVDGIYCLRAVSTAAVAAGDSGVALGSKRGIGLPFPAHLDIAPSGSSEPPEITQARRAGPDP